MTTTNEYFPQTVSHPGATLEEKLQEMGMSIKEFALRSDTPEKTIIAIIKEESAITHEMAIKFENVTQISANFWMRHQQRYDEYRAR
ncbi:MAG: addiction module antidote protein, HigA family [Clostridia bacterium]|nr:addiction module antidote protein, HigA family [Clostridia bacterium]